VGVKVQPIDEIIETVARCDRGAVKPPEDLDLLTTAGETPTHTLRRPSGVVP
jgi:hypothetical protein